MKKNRDIEHGNNPKIVTNSLGSLYQHLRHYFADLSPGKTGLEAYWLLEWAADINYKDIVSDPDRLLDVETLAKLESGLKRRLRGESIHRIKGMREFYGLPFSLSPDTLEPRPDSEALIDLVLPFIQQQARQKKSLQLLDMGTGSGILSIALLAHIPQLHATGVDIVTGALTTARQNAHLNGVEERFQPLASDWFSQVKGKYDFIISNPPYIAHADIATLDRTVRDFDPLIALDGGVDGLDFYRQLARLSGDFLISDGKIAVEIGQGQKTQVIDFFSAQDFRLIATKDDLAGICRALLFTAPI